MRRTHSTIYEAEVADISQDGKQVRIVKRHQPASPLEERHYVETLAVEQARELCESLTEAIDRA
jgi:hypothetical protein